VTTIELTDVVPKVAGAHVDVTVQVSASLNITATAARRKVNVFLLDQVGTGLGGGDPMLIVRQNRLCWRVPVLLALAPRGLLGQVGQVDLDAQSGELLLDEDDISNITDHAERLLAGSPL
jgi:hypothetical protein